MSANEEANGEAWTRRYDAVIIGGGPSGSVAATRLAMSGWRVAVVEQTEFPRRKVCGEYLSATNGPVLQGLGVLDAFRATAGPEVKRVALFQSHPSPATAALPKPRDAGARGEEPLTWGRALTRDRLDVLLLDRAKQAGTEVLQPWRCASLSPTRDGWLCGVQSMADRQQQRSLQASVVIAGHGSWSRQALPTQPPPAKPKPSDLLGFKAHFVGADLEADLMPLLAFPGGYGGMVTCQDGLVSLSCCVRRSVLDSLRREAEPGEAAGEAVFEHIRQSIPAVRRALDNAERNGAWLAAGPLRPGRRPLYRNRLFAVGNAAGEAHPVVAEGISMAMQSGWLAAECLAESAAGNINKQTLDRAGARYAQLWTSAFAPRIRASFAIAAWAMNPTLMSVSQPAIHWWPALLTIGARLSGKAKLTGSARDAKQLRGSRSPSGVESA